MVAQRHEFYFLVLKTIFFAFTALSVLKTLLLQQYTTQT